MYALVHRQLSILVSMGLIHRQSEELIASQHSVEEIREIIEADSLTF